MTGDKTFMKITNKDIYEGINILKTENAEQHTELLKHIMRTNGKVKKNAWVATTAMSIVIAILVGIAARGFL